MVEIVRLTPNKSAASSMVTPEPRTGASFSGLLAGRLAIVAATIARSPGDR
jgi:hypothetical protein